MMSISAWDMLARMGSAMILGGLIGFERERAKRQAGLRTHVVVALASATFMLVSIQFVYFQDFHRESLMAVDASRIAASVVTGIGFLGAGAILKTGLGIRGLTTAASLWLVASVGLACGGGMFFAAGAATAASLFALLVLRRLEHKGSRINRRITLVVPIGEAARSVIVDRLHRHGARIRGSDWGQSADSRETELVLDVSFPDEGALDRLIQDLEGWPQLKRVRIHRLIR